MTVHITELNSNGQAAWTQYVQQHPNATFFHTLAWRDAVTAAFNHQNHYLLAQRDGAITGILPLARVQSCLAGTILVSTPYAVYGGTLANDDESRDALMDHAQGLATRIHAHWLDIRSMNAMYPGLPVNDRYVTFRKPLPADPNEIFAALPRKARAAARQAQERHGLRVEFGDQHLQIVWQLYSQSMRRLASPNYPLRFFDELVRRTDGGQEPKHLVQLVLQGDTPVAGLLSFAYRGTFLPYFVGCDERYERCHPNNFLYMTAMQRAVEMGCNVFDFGRSRTDNTGSYEFKRNQGFEPTPLGYQYYVPEGGRVPDLYPSSPKLKLARRLWPRLPLAVTQPLGAWLAKSIPG